MNELSDKILYDAGLRLTPNRLLVLRELLKASSPLSLVEIESRIESLDKSSIFRVLTVLLEKNIVHTFEDGRGIVKYEVCNNSSGHTVGDMHAHFYCENCRMVFCFENQMVPAIELPKGYNVRSINYMLKGICPECSEKIPTK